jgi:hypothetical protein
MVARNLARIPPRAVFRLFQLETRVRKAAIGRAPKPSRVGLSSNLCQQSLRLGDLWHFRLG